LLKLWKAAASEDEDCDSDSTDEILDKMMTLSQGMKPLFGKTNTLAVEATETVEPDLCFTLCFIFWVGSKVTFIIKLLFATLEPSFC
jgi:hypothetical protein